MKERIKKIVILILCTVLFVLLMYKQEWLIIGISCTLFFILIYGEIRKYRIWKSEFVTISENLELLLKKEPISVGAINDDTLYSKILSQIQRISEINAADILLLEKEKNNTKELLAEIAHQLRTPLANMETYLALLEDDDLSVEDKQRYLNSVESAEKKISFLIEKFILAARMENKIIQIHKCTADLKETVAEAVFQVYKKAEEKKIYIELHEQENMDRKIDHDKNWIGECIYNLLDNSTKYSPLNSKIIIWLKNNEMFTEISVEDEGMGILPGEENKIFQMYYRGNNVTDQKGYGMGLFFTREIVKKHDGFMRVKRKDHGLIVSIYLPKTGT